MRSDLNHVVRVRVEVPDLVAHVARVRHLRPKRDREGDDHDNDDNNNRSAAYLKTFPTLSHVSVSLFNLTG